MEQMIPLFGPVPGGMEMMVILLIAVLLFGANKIPKLARSTGEAMGEFKKGRQEIEEELQEAQDEVAPETDPVVESDAETDTSSA
jgi:sec-independent protein translocase protein TatA